MFPYNSLFLCDHKYKEALFTQKNYQKIPQKVSLLAQTAAAGRWNDSHTCTYEGVDN
jgi:hypothetical protein